MLSYSSSIFEYIKFLLLNVNVLFDFQLVEKFVIGCNNYDEIGAVARVTLTPDKAVKLTLTER